MMNFIAPFVIDGYGLGQFIPSGSCRTYRFELRFLETDEVVDELSVNTGVIA